MQFTMSCLFDRTMSTYLQYLQISEMYKIPNPSLESSSTATSLNVLNSLNTSDPTVCVLAYSGITETQSALLFLLDNS